ncbi:MAG: hypothetical protein R3B51_03995 [Thermodesulfobacteriota bacterium]
MIISLNWLKEYVDFSVSPEELADRLTMSGLEVESIEYVGKALESVVVAEILDMGKHPDADKLSLCRVSDGEAEYPIVCGASNMKAGDKVALAKAGTVLPPGPKFPEGITIKKAKIRGQVSEGMLCAENELGLGIESDGIMILPPGAVPGTRLIDELGVNDVLLEIGITPNRPDCLSVVGTAREAAAVLSGTAGYRHVCKGIGRTRRRLRIRRDKIARGLPQIYLPRNKEREDRPVSQMDEDAARIGGDKGH